MVSANNLTGSHSSNTDKQDRLAKLIIYGLSFVAILFLFWLIYFKTPATIESTYPYWINHLNIMNAVLNFCSTVCLCFGFYFIKNKNVVLHQRFMKSAFVFSALFLVSYILYHHFHGDTKFQGTGFFRVFYFFILITHIVLSIVALPMVLMTFFYALKDQKEKHRKLAKFTFPIWLYVSVTGVLIYFLLQVH
jgi:putative membrane protein